VRIIKLMADYECFPLWEASPGVVGNIDPNELPLTAGLREELSEWARMFDAVLNQDDPAESGFASNEAEVHFQNMGRDLGRKLQLELGPDVTVIVKV
jgi:hypothetical protein